MDIYNYVSINKIKVNREKIENSFNPVFFILLIVKSFETLPKHSE